MAAARPDDALVPTVDVLLRTLRALGNARQPGTANRLAAQAWLTLRDTHPRQAERVNGAMHYLARLPQEPALATTGAPVTQEDT